MSDHLIEAIADVRAAMDLRTFELAMKIGISQEDFDDDGVLTDGRGMLLKGEILRRVVTILADRYIKNQERKHLKKYIKIKLDMDIGI
ncbi:hypothetical protein [Pseudomonas sp. MF6776]|jgi:hypothetical protein|uniref:hypothetical protein n=1 Tax=Pseudomonas sp. MF6776 TaxID=2797534 RepID=UPI00190D905D|nr:hypothetical protein [Pseudomonas sp. MF6776]MBK3469006.1 hypothetical protein [Pseudomonas sp. MF6776]|tara:strand:- start:335 stop:598 length:264 start_codon:yes stop_codon:yes gene_type:complete